MTDRKRKQRSRPRASAGLGAGADGLVLLIFFVSLMVYSDVNRLSEAQYECCSSSALLCSSDPGSVRPFCITVCSSSSSEGI